MKLTEIKCVNATKILNLTTPATTTTPMTTTTPTTTTTSTHYHPVIRTLKDIMIYHPLFHHPLPIYLAILSHRLFIIILTLIIIINFMLPQFCRRWTEADSGSVEIVYYQTLPAGIRAGISRRWTAERQPVVAVVAASVAGLAVKCRWRRPLHIDLANVEAHFVCLLWRL